MNVDMKGDLIFYNLECGNLLPLSSRGLAPGDVPCGCFFALGRLCAGAQAEAKSEPLGGGRGQAPYGKRGQAPALQITRGQAPALQIVKERGMRL